MSSGLLDIQALDAARSAGFSDAQITEVLLVIAGITFTNLFNRVNDTVLDFPAADALQS
jgi:alkylhydroperoxidase family enzyme